MSDSSKKRLNLYISVDLLNRLEFCSRRYGVSRAQMAVMLIGQGVASIEEAFKLASDLPKDFLNNNSSNKLDI